jgi:hypothetical protein
MIQVSEHLRALTYPKTLKVPFIILKKEEREMKKKKKKEK